MFNQILVVIVDYFNWVVVKVVWKSKCYTYHYLDNDFNFEEMQSLLVISSFIVSDVKTFNDHMNIVTQSYWLLHKLA